MNTDEYRRLRPHAAKIHGLPLSDTLPFTNIEKHEHDHNIGQWEHGVSDLFEHADEGGREDPR